jgi:hypothetical protein
VHVDIEGLDRVGLTVGDAVLGRQMKNDIRATIERIAPGVTDVDLVKLYATGDLLQDAVGEVVDPDHSVPIRQQALCKVTSDEPGNTGDQHRCHVT